MTERNPYIVSQSWFLSCPHEYNEKRNAIDEKKNRLQKSGKRGELVRPSLPAGGGPAGGGWRLYHWPQEEYKGNVYGLGGGGDFTITWGMSSRTTFVALFTRRANAGIDCL